MSAAPRRIPRAPLVLGLAGLLPFLWGALTAHFGSFGTPYFTHFLILFQKIEKFRFRHVLEN